MPCNLTPLRTHIVAVVTGLVTLSVASCASGDGRSLEPPVFPPPASTTPTATVPPTEPTETAPQPLRLVAPWPDGATVPTRHTCDGEGISPALTWANVPTEAVELAVTVTDLDAPDFVHWIVWGLAPGTSGLAEGTVPDGASLWPNGSGDVVYTGPCPPEGEEHRYVFTVHALNQQLEPADEMSATEIVETLNLISIAQSSVSGTFARSG